MLGAIAIVGPEASEIDRACAGTRSSRVLRPGRAGLGVPLACIEVLGRSTVDRVVGEWRQIGVDAITLLADSCFAAVREEIDQSAREFPPTWVEDAWGSVPQILKHYRECGIDAAVIVRVAAHIEADAAEVVKFHREQARPVARAFSEHEPLDFWIVDTASTACSEDVMATLFLEEPARYSVDGYVNRLADPCDFRRLVVDSLNSRCRLRPQGAETRPGVWMDEGAEVDRRARIVGPAFIGRRSKIEEQCLITRSSNVESNCQVDYGTVVEDSSILPNTYVGIGLDVSHSIVNRTRLLNLERDVTVDIGDPGIIRQNRIPQEVVARQSSFPTGWGRVGFTQSVKIPLEEGRDI